MPSTAVPPAPTRIAVFGPSTDSTAPGFRARYGRAEPSSPNATAVLERALALIAAKSPAIACPILARAVAAGTISPAERAELLGEVVGSPVIPGRVSSVEAQRLRHQVRAAIGRAAPSLARPLLDEAVASERLTPAQEARILQRLRGGAPSPVSSLL
jgi:hypothetical protein